MPSRLWFQPGTLPDRLADQARHALATGALQPIQTHYEVVEDGSIPFMVRIVANLERKQKATAAQKQRPDFNPFLPPEADLVVADLSDTHLGILNKYNVMDHHLLIITREFEDQDTWLTLADFTALWVCLGEMAGLGFYNAGRAAGASQPHKHLQLVPLPLLPEGLNLPIEQAFNDIIWDNGIGQTPGLPFRHAIASLEPINLNAPLEMATHTLTRYHHLLQATGLRATTDPITGPQTGPYNLLVTRQWMMVIPRSQEHYQSISINALGFAGTLLVRNQEQLELLKRTGPLTLLSAVTGLSSDQDAQQHEGA